MALTDVIAKIESGTTIIESLLPLIEQIAADAMTVGSNPFSIFGFALEVARALPQIEAAFKANNTEVTSAAGGAG